MNEKINKIIISLSSIISISSMPLIADHVKTRIQQMKA
ncbi:variable surface lipoprotein [Mycoplasmopsis bovis]